jgi:hypothetical protein
MSTTRALAGMTLAVGAAYALSRWPQMSTWGATSAEVAGTMPGDEVVGVPRYRTTHAVTIHAPTDSVWPWLVQMGQGRGGLYSYDWLENLLGLQIHSADRVVPELQDLQVGDVVRMVPEGMQPELAYSVLRLEAPRLLVLGALSSREDAFAAGMPFPCWTFALRPTDQGDTRLVVRFQSDFEPTLLGLLANKHALMPVHFVMERRMLLGIKERAERAEVTAAAG